MKTAMSIILFGADGQLGMDLQRALSGFQVQSLTIEDADVLDRPRVREIISAFQPDWVINAAALTNVDWCESNDLKAFEVNALGAKHIAESCPPDSSRIIQISTDYIFDGAKRAPYVESDPPNPLNAYGITKLAGEHYVRSVHPRHYIVRTSGLYGVHPCWGKKRNFVETMLALARERGEVRVVSDEVLAPTYAEDLANQIRRLIEAEPPAGIYHAANAGECSWYEFAETIFKLSNTAVKLEKTTAREWKAAARRPAYSVLRNEALRAAGIDAMPHWRDALSRYLSKRGG